MDTAPTRQNEHAFFYVPNPQDIIISNSAYCELCKEEVISVDPSVFATCKCANIKVKGGVKCILHTWINAKFYKRRCIVVEGKLKDGPAKKVSQLVKR